MPNRPKMSSTESEYIQLSKCCVDLDFFRKMFNQFLSIYDERLVLDPVSLPIKLLEDNQGAIYTAEGQGSARKLRHLDHCEHYVRDCQSDGTVKVLKVDTDDNTSDLLTKPPKSRPQMVRLWKQVSFEIRG